METRRIDLGKQSRLGSPTLNITPPPPYHHIHKQKPRHESSPQTQTSLYMTRTLEDSPFPRTFEKSLYFIFKAKYLSKTKHFGVGFRSTANDNHCRTKNFPQTHTVQQIHTGRAAILRSGPTSDQASHGPRQGCCPPPSSTGPCICSDPNGSASCMVMKE